LKSDSTKQIKAGMILSYLNLGIGNLIPFFYTPIMLELLGQSEYGLYKIASSTTSYLSLMALGIGGAVSRFIIKARAQEGKEAEARMFGLFNLLFQAIAILTLIVGFIITLNLDLIYGSSLTSAELYRMKILVGIMVVNTAVSFSATSYNSVVSAHERFVFIQCVNILSTICVPILNLVILFMGYRSIGMVVISLVITVAIRIIYIIYVRKKLEIKPLYNNMPISAVKEIFAFSFWVFISHIVGQIFGSTDTVIIGAVPALATVGAAVYSVGNTFCTMTFSLAQAAPSMFSPRINQMVFSGSTDEQLTDFVIKSGRIQGVIVALATSGFIAFGMPFLDWYVGPEYREAYWVAVIIMIPNCIPLVQSAAHSVIQAKNMHRFRSIVYLGVAILNIVGTILLVNKFGIIGAAIPTGVSYLVGHGFIMNWYYWKKIGLDIPAYWRMAASVTLKTLPMAAPAVALNLLLPSGGWLVLFAKIGLFSLLYLPYAWRFILGDYEKGIARSLIKKFR
jgi:O-antigen/teichoic acid export membrane protein